MIKLLKPFVAMLLLANTACSTSAYDYHAIGFQAAVNASLKNTVVYTSLFDLTAFIRIDQPSMPIRVYIEGDGFAWARRNQRSNDPTPHQAIALQLSSLDHYPNVIYMARPCQYRQTTKACDIIYWSSHRFSVEVVDAMNNALTQLNAKNRPIELVGYSGGAAIAALLTAKRQDVTNLRTIAGNLDHDWVNRYHHVDTTPNSLNAIDIASKISHIPQMHFAGLKDTIVPVEVAKRFIEKSQQLSSSQPKKNAHCVNLKLVQAEHQAGWTSHWPALLNIKFDCK